jgi:ribosome-binding protein aMBF1 (putative translation factor)
MKCRLVRESGSLFRGLFICVRTPLPVTKSEHNHDNIYAAEVNQNRNIVMILRPVQCKMARVALGMGVRELAAAAKVSVDTVARFERGEELRERTVEALQRALESAGITLIDENGGGPGVRLRKRQHKRASAVGAL